jgi:hypothetical protein
VVWIENPRVGGSIPPQATRFQRLGSFTAPGRFYGAWGAAKGQRSVQCAKNVQQSAI